MTVAREYKMSLGWAFRGGSQLCQIHLSPKIRRNTNILSPLSFFLEVHIVIFYLMNKKKVSIFGLFLVSSGKVDLFIRRKKCFFSVPYEIKKVFAKMSHFSRKCETLSLSCLFRLHNFIS